MIAYIKCLFIFVLRYQQHKNINHGKENYFNSNTLQRN